MSSFHWTRAPQGGRRVATLSFIALTLALGGCAAESPQNGSGNIPQGGLGNSNTPINGTMGAGTAGTTGATGTTNPAGTGTGTMGNGVTGTGTMPAGTTGTMGTGSTPVDVGAGSGDISGASGTSGTGVAGTGGTGVAGTGGAGGTGGTGGSGEVTTPADGHVPACISNPKQLVIIGDSYINWASHTFPADLANLAGTTGVWDRAPLSGGTSGGTLYAVGGTSVLTGEIPKQLDNALAQQDNVKVVLADGGGNDILLRADAGPCKMDGGDQQAVCQKIVADVLAAQEKMLQPMLAEGVTDIVFFFYPHVPLNTPLGGPNPNDVLDYALPMARDFCEGVVTETDGKIKCHFIDLIPVFEGHPDWFAPLDLHPNTTGSKAMAEAVWGKMKEDCVAQDASSGCCAP